MLFGISMYFVSQEKVFPLLEEALNLGIRNFEVGLEIPYLDLLDSRFFQKLREYESFGTSFSLHAPWLECNLGSLFPEIREFTKRRLISSIDCAQKWGLNPVILHPGFSFVRERGFHLRSKENFVSALKDVVSYAKERGINILIENVPFLFSFFYSPDEIENLKRNVDVKVCYDIGHSILMKKGTSLPIERSILKEIMTYKSDIGEIHLHNNFGEKDEHLLYEGILDLESVILGLKEGGFEGIVIVESSDIEKFGVKAFISLLKRLEVI